MTCVVCQSDQGVLNSKAWNGRPEGVVICPDCIAAITRREVGIVKRKDGSLHITDGRRLTA